MILKVAHRGASGYEPENTLAAFEKAIELEADAIELDVRACKTGELVVIHDAAVDRTTNGKGRVSNLSLKEIASLRIEKSSSQRIPTLRKALDYIDERAKVLIELKGKDTAKPTAEVIDDYLEKGWSPGSFFAASKNKDRLIKFSKLSPIKFYLIRKKVRKKDADFASKIGACGLAIKYTNLSKELVDNLHKKGLSVLAWTVNKKSDIEWVKSLGIDATLDSSKGAEKLCFDAIASNFPDRL